MIERPLDILDASQRRHSMIDLMSVIALWPILLGLSIWQLRVARRENRETIGIRIFIILLITIGCLGIGYLCCIAYVYNSGLN